MWTIEYVATVSSAGTVSGVVGGVSPWPFSYVENNICNAGRRFVSAMSKLHNHRKWVLK